MQLRVHVVSPERARLRRATAAALVRDRALGVLSTRELRAVRALDSARARRTTGTPSKSPIPSSFDSGRKRFGVERLSRGKHVAELALNVGRNGQSE